MQIKPFLASVVIGLTLLAPASQAQNDRRALVLMTDFGTTERFVASMKGVAIGVDDQLVIHDLTHHIEPYNIWQASYVLAGTLAYWPTGTVFVSVVDPGVGTPRKSVVVETNTGHFIVTPDNGTLTLIADTHGIKRVREIDESVNRRPGSEDMHTFHGRDVYVYTGARLAAQIITFADVGPIVMSKSQRLDYQQPKIDGDGALLGTLIHVETPFGNIVTNIPTALAEDAGFDASDNAQVRVTILHEEEVVYDQRMPFANSFGFVEKGAPLLYSDSLRALGLALNSDSFADRHGIAAGEQWTVRISR